MVEYVCRKIELHFPLTVPLCSLARSALMEVNYAIVAKLMHHSKNETVPAIAIEYDVFK